MLMRKFIKSFKRGEKGFTMIELLIVIAILGILAAVAIPTLSHFLGTSKIAAANTEMGMVKTAIAAGLSDAQTTTISGTTLNSGTDCNVDAAGTWKVGDYIQGGYQALSGNYTISGAGNITAATYGNPPISASGTPLKY